MSLQNPVSEEAVRWKAKFLDALEDQEKLEKTFRNRINLLRRGLVGVSLAGDGLDPVLDKELKSLRAALRADDSEAGLEPMLERIERSVLRLDAERDHGATAVRRAIDTSISQLQSASLSRELRRELRSYGKALPSLVSDTRKHPQLIVEFLDLLRRAVQQLTLLPDDDIPETGFWRRLFFGSGPEQRKQAGSAQTEPQAVQRDTVSAARASVSLAADPASPLTSVAAAEPLNLEMEVPVREDADPEQPGFSFIASHVEPLLLRILENIHLNEHSAPVAEQVRQTIAAGLHWYDFAAVLEDIAAIIASAIEQERTDFQGFLNEINTSLEQVQQFVSTSREHAERARSTDLELDSAVRRQVDTLHETVTQAGHIDELKQAVQGQLSAILNAIDSFRSDRQQQEAALAAETQKLGERVQMLEKESRELQSHLARQQDSAARDGLTGLPNRGAYDHRIRELLTQPGTRDRPFCLIVADVDLFKLINDSYGHLAGDKVLKILAKEITARIRQTDFVARYGGEEFVVIMQDADAAAAAQVMEKLRSAVSQIPFHFKETQVQITMSVGIAEAGAGDTADSLFDKADRALYMAKHAGRNRCQVFSNSAAATAAPLAAV